MMIVYWNYCNTYKTISTICNQLQFMVATMSNVNHREGRSSKLIALPRREVEDCLRSIRGDNLAIYFFSPYSPLDMTMLPLLLAVVVSNTSEAFLTTTRAAVHMFPFNVATNNLLMQDTISTTIDEEEDIAAPSSIQTIHQEVSKDDMKKKEEIDSSMIQQVLITDEDTKAIGEKKDEVIPSTWPHALHRFFLGEIGPPLVVLSILGFIYTRCRLPIPVSLSECTVFLSMIVFWSLQEYGLHRVVLHSKFNHIGKEIHQGHHDKNYFHISIDPPTLLLGWLLVAHLVIKSIFPWHICLSVQSGMLYLVCSTNGHIILCTQKLGLLEISG